VVAFWIILGIAVVAIVGLTARAVLAILVGIVLTMLAARACSHPKLTYFNGLRVVASINPTGETLVGQAFVLPCLAVATVFSWFLGLTWLLGARDWPRKRWLAFLRTYQRFARRLTYRN
jgi:hypothetical protein